MENNWNLSLLEDIFKIVEVKNRCLELKSDLI